MPRRRRLTRRGCSRGWTKLDGWYNTGLTKATAPVYAAFGKAMLDAEARWSGGVDPERVRKDMQARLSKLEEGWRVVSLPPLIDPPEAEVEELRRLLARRDKLPEKPTDDMLKPILAAFEALATKHKEKPQSALALAAAASQPLSVEGAKLLAPFDPLLAKVAASGLPAETARLLVQATLETRRAEHFPEEALGWGKPESDRAAGLLAKAVPDSLQAAVFAAKSARSIRAVAQDAIAARDQALGLLPGYLASDEPEQPGPAAQAVAAALRLKRLLAESANGAELEDATRASRQSLQALLRPLSPGPFRSLIERMDDDRPADIARGRLLLSSAWPTARQRSALRSALREGSRRRGEKGMDAPAPARRERDLARAAVAVLRLRLDGAEPVGAETLLGALRRAPDDAASWHKFAAALRRANASPRGTP